MQLKLNKYLHIETQRSVSFRTTPFVLCSTLAKVLRLRLARLWHRLNKLFCVNSCQSTQSHL